jgi:hypothetical protein
MLEINETKDKRQEFLDKFTEELIRATAMLLKERAKFEKELERVKRSIEIEKLKQKFEKYGEKPKKKHEKPKPEAKIVERPVQQIILRPIQRPVMMQPARPVLQKPAPLLQARPAVQPKPQTKAEAEKQIKEMPVTPIPIPQKQPTPVPGEINFEKLMFLVRDPSVTYIECPGIEKNVIIKRAGVTLKTQIKMNKDEILRIIKSFSEIARIPLIEGLLTARIQNLEISAVVTQTGSPSFIIRKILFEVRPTGPSILAPPSMPGAIAYPPARPAAMPPVMRPFTPGAAPSPANQFQQAQQAKPAQEQKKEGFWNKKVTFGK